MSAGGREHGSRGYRRGVPEVDVWQALTDELTAGGSCALLAVADSRGSTPGRVGALMAVGPTGPLGGTIGGGVAEAGLVDSLAAQVRSGAVAARLVPMVHREDAPGASGMVCGGTQVVAVCPIGPGDLPGVRRAVEALTAGRTVVWTADPGGWRVVSEGPGPGLGLVGRGSHWSYHHRSGPTHTVHVVGGGHVGAALAPLLLGLEFRVVVVEERPGVDLARIAAHERLRLPYEELGAVVPPGPRSFVAIMAHAHDRDAAGLAAVRSMRLGYLGLLGSRAKVRRLVGDRAMPDWFHAPMGLPIGSTTPAEIAVSVAAQMLAVRAAERVSS